MESNILEFECVGLNDGGKFPIENTGRGQDISPEFIIRNLNTNAVTLMITLEDLSHPIKGFTHWIIWNIPATDKIIKAKSCARRSLWTPLWQGFALLILRFPLRIKECRRDGYGSYEGVSQNHRHPQLFPQP